MLFVSHHRLYIFQAARTLKHTRWLALVPRALVCALLTVGLSGCADLPLYNLSHPFNLRKTPDAADLARLKASTVQPTWKMSREQLMWLDPILNSDSQDLLNAALQHNESLQRRHLNVAVAGYTYQQVKREREPNLDLNLSAQRSRNANSGSSNQLELGLGLNWDLDIWGILKVRSQQAYIDWLNVVSEYQEAKNQIYFDVLSQYLENAQNTKKIAIFQAREDKLSEQAITIEDNYLNGVTQARDVLQSRSDIQQVRTQRLALMNTLDNGKKKLVRLIGQRAGSTLNTRVYAWDEIKKITALPQDWSLQEIIANPSIQQQWLGLLSSDAELAIAHRNRWPQLSLGASGRFINTSANQWLNHEQLFWSLIAQLTQPILNQRELVLEVKKQQLNLQRQELNYIGTLEQTFSELYQLYSTEQYLQQQYQINQDLLDMRVLNETLALEEYLQGVIDYDSLLQSQRNVLEVRSNLVDLVANIYRNRLQLLVIMGGDNQPLFRPQEERSKVNTQPQAETANETEIQ